MTVSAAFLDLITDMLRASGPITSRRMFGGAGIFRNGLMFALVADDVLYLKADAVTAEHFVELGLEPFVYGKDDKRVAMSYRRAPEAMFEDPDEARVWSRRALDAAIRSAPSQRMPRGALRRGPAVR